MPLQLKLFLGQFIFGSLEVSVLHRKIWNSGKRSLSHLDK